MKAESMRKQNRKLLFYISTIRGGGAARVMVNIANGLSSRGYEICFVTNFPSDHEYVLKEDIRRINIEEKESNKGFLEKNYRRTKALRKIVRAESPGACIAFMVENNIRLILATAAIRTKTIVSVRNDPAREYNRKGFRLFANLLYSKADCIIFQTKDAQRWFSKSVRKKSRVIINQIDSRFFCDSDSPGSYIVACGRLVKQKDYPMLLHAFKSVLHELPGEQLMIYGEGELKDELVNLTKKLCIDSSVHFEGYESNMQEVYRNAKILVLTSQYEGMPNVLLEALASSVPVVSTDCPCGGPRMVIEDGVNGFLVPVGDSLRTSEAIVRIIGNENTLKTMRKESYITAQSFHPENILDNWERMILETT